MKTLIIDGNSLTLDDVLVVAGGDCTVKLAAKARPRMQASRMTYCANPFRISMRTVSCSKISDFLLKSYKKTLSYKTWNVASELSNSIFTS